MSTQQANSSSALEQLADRYGISRKFEDAYGHIITVEPQTISQLLDSMGVKAGNDEEAAAALERFDEKAGERALPATIVVVPEKGASRISVKAPGGTGSLDWQVMLEDGGELTGSSQAEQSGDDLVLSLADLPLGYHRLRLPDLDAEANIIVSPGQCWLPADEGPGYWGIAIQLYLLRSAGNWGIGDFSDLAALIEQAGSRGCALIGLNPLHQMFLDNPEQASPYSPATRLFLNPLYIDVTAVPEFDQSPEAKALFASPSFQQRLEHCRAAKLVDYTEVTALKLEALHLVYEAFAATASPQRQDAFAAFRQERGESLERAALFQVMRDHLGDGDPEQADWRNWPADLQIVVSDGQRQFADQHRAEIDFQSWLQFIADEQLARAAEKARGLGMAVGLYRDLAVGCDAAGAETWANPSAFIERTLVGAPPDIFNPAGQNWGLPPFDPVALAEEGYRSFAELIRANMRHSGGLRIDHVMGLSRLFCIPEGNSPAEGAYVSLPLDDLIGVLALESQRHKCLVVGEDLGTVPPGFRERLAAANILSYRVLFFEQDFDTGVFLPPDRYPRLALANTGSHDLPTLEAWWEGEDIALKESLGLYGDEKEAASQRERRDRERENIVRAFTDAGLLAQNRENVALRSETVAQYAHQFLAQTRALLLTTQLDDMTRDTAPVNVPGTSTEHPNWRRKYRLTLEELTTDTYAWNLAEPLARGGS